METVAEHIRRVVTDAVTAGRLPAETRCGPGTEPGRLEVTVPGKAEAWVEAFVAAFSSPGEMSLRYPGLEAGLPEGPPFVVTPDPLTVWHFRWSITDPDGGLLHNGWMEHDLSCLVERLVSAANFDPAAGSSLAKVRITPPAPAPSHPVPDDVALVMDPSLGTVDLELPDLDVRRIAEHWPRDARGRLAPRTKVLLATIGEVARGRRQPCVMISSAPTLKQMPSFTVAVSDEIRHNVRHNWSRHPHLWSAVTPPSATALERRCRELLATGRWGQACELARVQVEMPLLRLLQGLPTAPGALANPDHTTAAGQLLARLAPWQLGETVAWLHEDLQRGRRTRLSPAGWEMKLGWFPGQRTASRIGIMLTQTKDGAPALRLAWNGDNATVPAEWWQS
ncbi:MAG: hypothetical protein Q4D89_13755 [Arachnia propionica]|uniref:hypothetical protein n=1 Tax=Arachnia propionica TaxID=1750 RepID=UPI0027055645|nr:hypothetical protein [Arachnia propionica]